MGGKKPAEKNRNYEKNRRDRFNIQFAELCKLLPEVNSAIIKNSKADIIGRTIQYIKDAKTKNEKLENDFEKEKSKISELQKKIAGLLHVIKELIKLLHKSSINFSTSLPLNDFVSLKDIYVKSKRKSRERRIDYKRKKRKFIEEIEESENSAVSSDESSYEKQNSNLATVSNAASSESNQICNFSTSISPATLTSSETILKPVQPGCNATTTTEVPVLKLNSNLILPNGNLVAVNNVPNVLNNSSTILLNKQVTIPTLIVMQNGVVPVESVTTQPIQKMIAPKQNINTTKSTFINKKPIPAIGLYKSQVITKNGPIQSESTDSVQPKRLPRSAKGILVQYPKRKSSTKGTKCIERKKIGVKKSTVDQPSQPPEKSAIENQKNENFSNIENCYVNETFAENTELHKNYNLFDTPTDTQASVEFHSKQLIDFFDNSSRNVDNSTENNTTAQNVSFYTATSCSSTVFSTYNMFKYNEPVTSSYYSIASQPFTIAKSTDTFTDFPTWPVFSQDETQISKEKSTKRDKCSNPQQRNNSTSSSYGLTLGDVNCGTATDKSAKPDKTHSPKNRPLVNWMTSPDSRNVTDPFPLSDIFAKDDATTFTNNSTNTVGQNTLNSSFSSIDLIFDNTNQNYDQISKSYSGASSSFSWSPSKSHTLPHLETRTMVIPSTIPSLIDDLALGGSNFSNFDLLQSKKQSESEKNKKDSNLQSQQNSFLSVLQLVDDKDENTSGLPKLNVVQSKSNKQINADMACPFDTQSEQSKSSYSVAGNNSVSGSLISKNADKNMKLSQNTVSKCNKKDNPKFNIRCLSKENKKTINRPINQQQFMDGSTSNNELCNSMRKDITVLSSNNNTKMNHIDPTLTNNKNSNYSAESLISGSNHQICSSQNYFQFENNTNFVNCNNKQTDNDTPHSNYFSNSNYAYHNNFTQSFNNYGFSNQGYNNYTPVSNSEFDKRKENNVAKQDVDWFKASFSNYNLVTNSNVNNIVGGSVNDSSVSNNSQNKTDVKYKFSHKYANQKANTYNTKCHYNNTPSILSNKSNSSCNFNSSCTFEGPQQYTKSCITNSSYNKTGNAVLSNDNNNQITASNNNQANSSNNSHSVASLMNNSNSVTSLTNFNLSAIIPEINDKCPQNVQNGINSLRNDKQTPKYNGYKVNMDEINNYSYLIQPSAENTENASVYGSSNF